MRRSALHLTFVGLLSWSVPLIAAAQEPVVEEPAVEEPAVEEPAVEEPAVEEPAVEEPAVEERGGLGELGPSAPDQDETTGSTIDRAPDRVSLQKQIDLAKQRLKVFPGVGGCVIVGQVQVEGEDDPAMVRAQMQILEGGFFAGPTRDVKRPVGFRMHQYAPFDLQFKGNVGEVVDVGIIRMRRLSEKDLVSVMGQITPAGSPDASQTTVSFSEMNGPVNTPSNGTEPRRRWSAPITVPVDASGVFHAGGFSPIEYYCSIHADGYVSKGFPVTVQADSGADLGVIVLENPLRIAIEYIVEREGLFDPGATKKQNFAAGTRWKAMPDIYGWDLEFVQQAGAIQFNYSYGPCRIADLGEGQLQDYLDSPASAAKQVPHKLSVNDGHVYLLKQDHWKRNVLFKIRVLEPNK